MSQSLVCSLCCITFSKFTKFKYNPVDFLKFSKLNRTTQIQEKIKNVPSTHIVIGRFNCLVICTGFRTVAAQLMTSFSKNQNSVFCLLSHNIKLHKTQRFPKGISQIFRARLYASIPRNCDTCVFHPHPLYITASSHDLPYTAAPNMLQCPMHPDWAHDSDSTVHGTCFTSRS